MSKIIVLNWKCNPQTDEDAEKLLSYDYSSNHKVIVCPPFLYLKRGDYKLGAQDVFYEKGSHTGEISVDMLKNRGVEYVLVGHSEKKKKGENINIIKKKIRTLIGHKLCPIYLVGEMERDDSLGSIKKQLEILDDINKSKIIFVYEPAWAISPNPPCSVEHAIKAKEYIESIVGKKRILYGGSANSTNYKEFLEEFDGLVIGAASLIPEDFLTILKGEDKI